MVVFRFLGRDITSTVGGGVKIDGANVGVVATVVILMTLIPDVLVSLPQNAHFITTSVEPPGRTGKISHT